MFPIATALGTGSSGVITFSSIPQTFTHLQLRMFARMDGAVVSFPSALRFNGDATSIYSIANIDGDGSTATSGGQTSVSLLYPGISAGGSAAANIYGASILDILDYTNTNKNKSTRCITGVDRNGAGNASVTIGLWSSTAAITSLSFLAPFGNWTALTRVDLYGISTANATGA
jgi:hypothetical protein